MASIDARYHLVTFLRFWLAEIASLSEVDSFRPFFHSAVLCIVLNMQQSKISDKSQWLVQARNVLLHNKDFEQHRADQLVTDVLAQ
jgi:hypothetical protein